MNVSAVYQYDWVEFNTTWIENESLSYSIFSTNLSGQWKNATPQTIDPSDNTSMNLSYIGLAPSTVVSWMFYANNSFNEWNQTPVQSFMVGGVVWNQTTHNIAW